MVGAQISNYNGNYIKGNGTIWKFADSTYQYYQHHQLISSGPFITGKDTCLENGKFMNYFVIKKNNNEHYYIDKLFFEYIGQKLVMYQGVVAADGTNQTYARL